MPETNRIARSTLAALQRRRKTASRNTLLCAALLLVACGSRDERAHESLGSGEGAVTASGDLTKVTPILECVATSTDALGNPQHAAVFGYENTSTGTVIAPIGATNGIVETGNAHAPPFGRGQPVAFAPGRHDGVFAVDFVGDFAGPLTWTLGGQSATATLSSPICQTFDSPDGPISSIGSVLVQPDPSAIANAAILPTETGSQGTAVGTVRGNFQVAGGAATYSIPLWTPPARMGVGPSLALAYSSRAARGLLGYGWDLSGFSRIARCAKTVAQDGDAAAISFNDDVSGDAFCLDGQRMWLDGKVADGKRTYKLERDPFTRIDFDEGGQTFRVFQRDGRVLTYGTTPEARDLGKRWQYATSGPQPLTEVTYAWALDAVTDTVGNRMNIKYRRYFAQEPLAPDQQASCNQIVPDTVTYTAGPESAADRWPARRWVSFDYETTDEPSCRFISGFGFGSSARLTHVRAYGPGVGNGELLRAYNLGYASSNVTQRSLLTSIEECDGAGVCAPRTTFDYSAGSRDFDSVLTNVAPAGAWSELYYDWDADGRDDLIFGGEIYRNDGSRFVDTGTTTTIGGTPLRSTSMNAKDDTPLLVRAPHRSVCTKAQIEAHQCQKKPPPRFLDPLFVGDFDGNGENDLVAQNGVGFWLYRLTDYPGSVVWNSNALLPDMSAPDLLRSNDPDPTMYEYVAPIDGSGKSAFLFRRGFTDGTDGPNLVAVTANASNGKLNVVETTLPVGDKWMIVSNPNCYDDPLWEGGSIGPCSHDLTQINDNTFYWVFVDLNGDGNADALQVPVTGGPPKVALNTGAGFGPVIALPGATDALKLPDHMQIQARLYPLFPQQVQVADLNDDGLPDVLVNGNTVYWSRGLRGVTAGALNTPQGNVIDFDGDGQPDLETIDEAVYRHTTKPDHLVGIHNGFGKDINVSYTPITDEQVYTRPTGCTYPKTCVNGGMWVVSEYSVSADWGAAGKVLGSVKPNTYRFHYEGARSDVRGRGWLGFASETVTDVQNSATTTTTYNNDETDTGFGYPRAGMPTSVVTTASANANTQRVSTTTTTYDALPQLGGHGVLVRPSATETVIVERVNKKGTWYSMELAHARTTLGYDDYSNPTLRETTYVSSDPEQTASERWQAKYDQNISSEKWLLSLLRRTDLTSNEPWQPSVTRSHSFDPDADTGLLKHETIEPEGGPELKQDITYERDDRGQVTHVTVAATDPVSGAPTTREVWIKYDIESLFPTSVTNSLGHTARSVYHAGLGLLLFEEDANGVLAHHRYDGFGRLRADEVDGVGATTVHYRDGTPFPGAPLSPASVPGLHSVETDAVGGGHAIVTYNALGDEVARAVRNHDGSYSYVETRYTYIAGQVAAVSRPSAQATATLFTTFEYDLLGRVVKTTLPDGRYAQLRYHNFGTTSVDPQGHLRTQVVDMRGRVVRVDEEALSGLPDTAVDPTVVPQRSDTSVSTNYAYGAFGTLLGISTTDRDGNLTSVASMTYDDLGRRTSVVEANSGKTTTTYDAFGQSVKETDANAQTHTMSRDELGRLVADVSSQDGTTTYEWDTAPHGIGKVSSMKSGDAISTLYAYDAKGRPTQTRWQISGDEYAVDSDYDDQGRVWRLTYPQVGAAGVEPRLAITFGFDQIGAAVSATGSDSHAPFSWSALAWNASGQVTTDVVGDSTTTKWDFDQKSAWLNNLVAQRGSETIQDLHYEHDGDGNIKVRQDNVLGTNETFAHDWLERTQQWTLTSNQGTYSTTYEYSDIGNIQSRSIQQQGGPSTTAVYAYGSRDAASSTSGLPGVHAVTNIGSDAYTYDPKGNQITGPGGTIKYTSFGLPRTVTKDGASTMFRYDADHHRALKKGANGAMTRYAGGLYEKRQDGSGNTAHVFHALGFAQVEWTTNSAGTVVDRKVTYLHSDHLGSITATSSANAPTAQLRYDPFGKRINPYSPLKPAAPPAGLTSGFTDQEHDDELGIINMQGRIYDPQIGRFLSVDPLAPVQTSQGHNRYSYVLNQPLALTDPSGFSPPSTGNGGGMGESGLGCQRNAYLANGSPGMGACAAALATAGGTIPTAERCNADGTICVSAAIVVGPADTPPQPPPPGSTDSGGKGPMVAPVGSLEARANQAVERHMATASDMTNLDPMGMPLGSGGLASAGRFFQGAGTAAWNTVFDAPAVVGYAIRLAVATAKTLNGDPFVAPTVVGHSGLHLNESQAPEARAGKYVFLGSMSVLAGLGMAQFVAREAGWLATEAAEGVCAGGLCPCFVAGTLIDTEAGSKPIEETALGDRVGPELAECATPELAQWREVDLAMVVQNDGVADELEIRLLRPEEWIRGRRAFEGNVVSIHLDDLNVSGNALVTRLGGGGHVALGTRCPVTGWVRHISHDVIPLALEGGETLKVTRHHRLFSADRGDWVRAGDLKIGEALQTKDGIVHVASSGAVALAPAEVFNLEVIGAHRYFVGERRVWAHNQYAAEGDALLNFAEANRTPDSRFAAEYTSESGAKFYDVNRPGGRENPFDHHGGCAEIGCMLQAQEAEGSVTGGSMRTIFNRPAGTPIPPGPPRGQGAPATPCPDCQKVLNARGIAW